MPLFWIAAGSLAAGSAVLILLFSRRAMGSVGGANPALAVHQRQLSEISELKDRGLLGDGEASAARTEAARRLLSTAALTDSPETRGTRVSRLMAAAVIALVGVGALGLYAVLGAPGLADQPYAARVAAWRKTDPSTLDAPRMAEVLKTIALDRPNDPEVFNFLGKTQMAMGDPFSAQQSFATAARLAPQNASYHTQLGEARLAAGGEPLDPDAAQAVETEFNRALALDSQDIAARYALGRTEVSAGDRQKGVSQWRTLLAELPANDPRRSQLSAQIERVAAGGPLEAPDNPAAAAGGEANPAPFIRAMVASLAAKLKAHPDDPAGWAQLVRSYGVLHDASGQADALGRARRQFSASPQALGAIEAEAKSHPA